MKTLTRISTVLLAAGAFACTFAAHADQLADIKAKGVLVCGVMPSVEPMGFMDPGKGEVVGYDIDFCKAVAKSLGVKIELKVVSSEARIPELLEKRVDILAAILGYTAARAEQIDYSQAYFVSNQILAVKKGSDIKVRDDVAGKRVSTMKGSSNLVLMHREIPTAQMVSYDDAPSAFIAMAQGKVNAFVLSEVMLRRFAAKLGDGNSIEILKPAVGVEYWGLGIRKGEPELLRAVNDALSSLEKTGEAQKIFDTWLGPNTLYKMTRDFKVAPIKH